MIGQPDRPRGLNFPSQLQSALGRCLRGCVVVTALAAMMSLGAGCTALKYVATAALPPDSDPPPARYHGLGGQTCAVMVWADFSTRADFGTLRDDIGGNLQEELLRQSKEKDNKDYLEGLRFPYPARSVVLFQDQNSELQSLPINELALKLGIPNLTRVVYVEVQHFQTRAEKSFELFRGEASVNLSVVEISGETSKVAFKEEGITVHFPHGPGEASMGSDKINDQTVKAGTVAELTYAISKRFYEAKATD